MIRKEVEFELVEIDFLTRAEFGGGGLEFVNPEKIGGEVLDFAGAVVFGEFLFVVVETGGKTAFGIFVHFVSANLKFDNVFFGCDDGGVDRLITVLLGHGDIIFNTAV